MDRSGRRVCAATGLALVASAGRDVWRIQKRSYGAMNPLVPTDLGDVGAWGRWDVLDHRTIYAGATAQGAYLETLQSLRLDPGASPRLGDLFDHDDEAGQTLLDAVTQEWEKCFGGFIPGRIPSSWRHQRALYRLRLPRDGWLVDVGHSDSVAAVAQHLPEQLEVLNVSALTLEHIHGTDRALTTAIAEWIHGLVLDDGSLPHGIRYNSKWGNEQACYAIWLRAIDDGKPRLSEPTSLIETHDIEWDSPDLAEAMRKHRLHRSF